MQNERKKPKEKRSSQTNRFFERQPTKRVYKTENGGERAMIVPVSIHYRELEELCYYDDWEKGVICDNYNAEHEYTVDECEFDYTDLKDIVEEYTDDIIDIILSDKQLMKALLKKMRSRKIDAKEMESVEKTKK